MILRICPYQILKNKQCSHLYLSVVYSTSSIHIKKTKTVGTRIYHHCSDNIED